MVYNEDITFEVKKILKYGIWRELAIRYSFTSGAGSVLLRLYVAWLKSERGAAVWDNDSQSVGGGARCSRVAFLTPSLPSMSSLPRMEDHLVKIHIKVKIKISFQETNEEGVYLAGSCMSFVEWEWLIGLEIGQCTQKI
ncbi:hypothetical protein BU17DRAFT_63483 [Hysterangium stoloniferum]|nr:hypothetical protein BU17DRAFT_63483 [Hysterangium stoloniferum]